MKSPFAVGNVTIMGERRIDERKRTNRDNRAEATLMQQKINGANDNAPFDIALAA